MNRKNDAPERIWIRPIIGTWLEDALKPLDDKNAYTVSYIRADLYDAAIARDKEAEVGKLRKIATQALAVIEDVQTYEEPDDPWTENALTMRELVVFDFDVQAARAALHKGATNEPQE